MVAVGIDAGRVPEFGFTVMAGEVRALGQDGGIGRIDLLPLLWGSDLGVEVIRNAAHVALPDGSTVATTWYSHSGSSIENHEAKGICARK